VVANRAPGEKTSGNFDFYVLSLSWSPGFCATQAGRNDPEQCGPQRHFAFVLHGLWPQYEQKGWPEDCSTEGVDQSIVEGMLNIMPSPKLVEHEWQKHGTCSGLSAKEYFEEAADAFESVKVPAAYQQLTRELSVSPEKIKANFVAANPGFGEQGFSVLCSSNGRYLQEIHACLTRDLEGHACNREVQQEACRSDQVVMRPVR
jgi:ribonuclease T2